MTSPLESVPFVKQPIFLGKAPNIDFLPKELYWQIFSYLNQHDLQITVFVSKRMKSRVIEAVNHNAPISIKNFIQHLIPRLNGEKTSKQRDLLIGISQDITTQKFVSFPQLRRYTLDIKAQLINVIESLDEQIINDLKAHIQPPEHMEDIFVFAAIVRQIDEANLISDLSMRLDNIKNIFKTFTQTGHESVAIAFAMSLSDEEERTFALQNISKALTTQAVLYIDKAREAKELIPDEQDRGDAPQNIAEALTTQADLYLDKAREVATSIPDEYAKRYALQNISKALTTQADLYIDKAREVEKLFSPAQYRRISLRYCSGYF